MSRTVGRSDRLPPLPPLPQLPEKDDEETADALQPDLLELHQPAESGGGGSKHQENQREAADEEQGVRQCSPAVVSHLLERHSRDKRQITGNKREHARRKKAQHPGRERDEETYRSSRFHNINGTSLEFERFP